MPTLNLKNSVGIGGTNDPSDVAIVSGRLRELGFHWADLDTTPNGELIWALRLFQAIKNGSAVVDKPQNDGRVDNGGETHKWLEARNAPRWQNIEPTRSKLGWVKHVDGDEQDYGTGWLQDCLAISATIYRLGHLAANPNAAPITVNDCSLPAGGPVDGHEGHETGLMCDLRLPKLDGSVGGITWKDPAYDRAATRAMLQSMQTSGSIKKVFFNDTTLIGENLCVALPGHDNHVHIEVAVPNRT